MPCFPLESLTKCLLYRLWSMIFPRWNGIETSISTLTVVLVFLTELPKFGTPVIASGRAVILTRALLPVSSPSSYVQTAL